MNWCINLRLLSKLCFLLKMKQKKTVNAQKRRSRENGGEKVPKEPINYQKIGETIK